MKRFTIWAGVLLAGCAFLALGGKKKEPPLPDYANLMRVEKQFQRGFRFYPGGRINISTGFMGNVEIQGWEKSQVLVEGVVTAWGYRNEDMMANVEKIQPAFSRNEADMVIATDHPKEFQLGKIDYRITVPKYRTDITIKSNRGLISVRNVHGWLEADTVTGYLALVGLSGYVSAKTENGDIMVQFAGHRFQGHSFQAKTKKGNISLYLPSTYSADLSLITLAGTPTADYPSFTIDEKEVLVVPQFKDKGGFINQRLREGGAVLMLQTDAGDVKLVKFDEDTEYLAPAPPPPAGEAPPPPETGGEKPPPPKSEGEKP